MNVADGPGPTENKVSITAFGHTFRDLLPGLAENLITLEKEGAIYAHFYIETSNQPKFYRIRFLPSEIFQYVEAHLAKQEFDRAIRAQTTPGKSRSERLEVGLAASQTRKSPIEFAAMATMGELRLSVEE